MGDGKSLIGGYALARSLCVASLAAGGYGNMRSVPFSSLTSSNATQQLKYGTFEPFFPLSHHWLSRCHSKHDARSAESALAGGLATYWSLKSRVSS
jgi:hypothetical protein